MSWLVAVLLCALSFVGFSVIVMAARGTWARRAWVAMWVSFGLVLFSSVMYITAPR